MRIEEVEKLLEEYYEGRTTEAQEQALREFFTTNEIPEKLAGEKKVFLALCSLKQAPEPQGLEERLNHLIDQKAGEGVKVLRRNNARRNWRWVSGMAAAILLIVTLAFSTTLFNWEGSHPKDTFTDPREAYLVMQNTLIEVSANLNDGLAQLSEVKEEIVEINKEIKEEIQ